MAARERQLASGTEVLAVQTATRPPKLRECAPVRRPDLRVGVSGKFFTLGDCKWYVKGLTYGPFAPNSAGRFLPERGQWRADFSQLQSMGANSLRLYHPPPRELLDDAVEAGLRVLIDVPWEKHRCFFEDYESQQDARHAVRRTARELGGHPAVLGISVANEIPHDIVRFYGAERIEQFIASLLDEVKQQAPECLATYTNYPSSEFLNPPGVDFACFNVYLNDPEVLGRYLDRLQHVAGALPLVLGEYGLDSIRHGEDQQGAVLSRHVREVFRHGLAGSFVFSFTDDWFTGGHQVEDWAFGITRRDRTAKPAARLLRRVWDEVPCLRRADLPKVSVVVCSYNGAATLRECLESLVVLDYPDYEVILVDDGSTDNTPEIAADFPSVQYTRQSNSGLSVARNVGARQARGEIVAYTDSDCVVDPSWLLYLVEAMRDQEVDAIGGPNVTPPSDGWIAQCVAVSPGNPGHVMLDDRYAEHIPGCNMAFCRATLLELGGFDAQFMQAGDDVDVCWRFLDAGLKIGYAPAALVWHHRRRTVRAYLRQQRGYGRSEAMLQFKHPQRFNGLGCSRWNGVIYGEGAAGLPVSAPVVHHGRFGSALFQMIYRSNRYSPLVYTTLLEWHVLAAVLLGMSFWVPSLAIVGGLMVFTSALSVGLAAVRAPMPADAPVWCRPAIAMLHLLQPVVRSYNRYAYRLGHKRIPAGGADGPRVRTKWISVFEHDLYWRHDRGRGREHLLEVLVAQARRAGWRGDFDAEWKPHDLELMGGLWYAVMIRTVSEELGSGRRFTRVRMALKPTRLTWLVVVGCGLLTFGILSAAPVWAPLPIWAALTGVLAATWQHCRQAVARLVWRSGLIAELVPVVVPATVPQETVTGGLAESAAA